MTKQDDSLQAAKGWMILWMVSTIGGWLLGGIMCFVALGILRLIFGFSDKTAALEVIVIGICLGTGLAFVQWRIALKDIVSRPAWNVACVVAVFLVIILWILSVDRLWPAIFNCFHKGCLSASCDVCVTRETWLVGTGLASLGFGLVVALPTAFVLSRFGSHIYLWIVGCILTAFITILVGIVVVASPSFLELFLAYCFCLGPATIGVISAPFIYAVLKESPRLSQ